MEHLNPELLIEESRRLSEKLNECYKERNQCIAAFCKLANRLGWPVYLAHHQMENVEEEWDNEWSNVVFVETPEGQVSWHIHRSELPLFKWMSMKKKNPWDGHDTEEKYDRLSAIHHEEKP